MTGRRTESIENAIYTFFPIVEAVLCSLNRFYQRTPAQIGGSERARDKDKRRAQISATGFP